MLQRLFRTLAAVTLPYLLNLASDPKIALAENPGFAAGLNVANGKIMHPGLAKDLAALS